VISKRRMTLTIKILKSGLLTTIQDEGRKYFRRFGIPQSGAMDLYSLQLANYLVNNPFHFPAFECTLYGGTFQFLNDSIIGISGAPMSALLNKKHIELNQTHFVKKNDVLELGFASAGCRTYLAIQGQIHLPKVFGSYSTYTLANIGGRILQKNDEISWHNPTPTFQKRTISEHFLPRFQNPTILRILKGPEFALLSEASQHFLTTSTFTIHPQSDRMGIRLIPQNATLSHQLPALISSATTVGTIQLPKEGNPIILMKDGQTTGGYPRIAQVVATDLNRLAQIPPNQKARFRFIDLADALDLLRHRQRLLQYLLY